MRLENADNGIMIDDEFLCSSAGEMRLLAQGSYEVGFQPEEIPRWFQAIMGHIDRTALLHETRKQIADAGCYLNLDLFGREELYYASSSKIDMPNDATRMDDISAIISEGFGGKVLVPHDICSKHRLVGYGGHGYHYILATSCQGCGSEASETRPSTTS
jgi:hypothetical protein